MNSVLHTVARYTFLYHLQNIIKKTLCYRLQTRAKTFLTVVLSKNCLILLDNMSRVGWQCTFSLQNYICWLTGKNGVLRSM